MNATETRQAVLDAEAKKAAELVEQEAIFRELEYDAAWEAYQTVQKDNVELKRLVEFARSERDKFSIRSYGYTRLYNITRRVKSGSITKEMAWQQMQEAVDEINQRVENVGK